MAGLLDAAATVGPGGAIRLTLASKRLAEDIRELIAGLGHRVHMESSGPHTLMFTTADDVFRLERKKLAHKESGARSAPGRACAAGSSRSVRKNW